jgi:hypothetical protein
MPIYFHSTADRYGWLSNFSSHGFGLDGKYWPTVEHYFQAQKFEDGQCREKIRRARNPKEAKRLGRSRSWRLRRDWESVKADIMRKAVQKKFETHDDLRQMLLETGDEDLVEHSRGDSYWGSGPDGNGKNMLGKVLMEVRPALSSENRT